jgi:hypothetical protein
MRHDQIRQALLDECAALETRIQQIRTEWVGDESRNETGRRSATEGAAAFVDRRKIDRRRPVVC